MSIAVKLPYLDSVTLVLIFFFFSSRRRHTRLVSDWSSDVCSSDLAEDRDVHQATAAEVFGIAPDAVSADQRRSAKAINFGLMYGMSAFGLARQLGIDRKSVV